MDLIQTLEAQLRKARRPDQIVQLRAQIDAIKAQEPIPKPNSVLKQAVEGSSEKQDVGIKKHHGSKNEESEPNCHSDHQKSAEAPTVDSGIKISGVKNREPISEPQMPTNEPIILLAPTPLPELKDCVKEENQVLPSLNLGKTEFKPSSKLVTEPRQNLVKTQVETSLNLGKPADLETKSASDVELNQVKPSSKPRHQSGQNLVKTQVNSGLETAVLRIVGLQKVVTNFLLQRTLETQNGTAGYLSAHDIASACNTSLEGARTTIKELIKKGIIDRISFKEGRGGWSQYRITPSIYQSLISGLAKGQPSLNLGKTEFKSGLEPGLKSGQNRSSSSSSLLYEDIKLTTTEETEETSRSNLDLPEEWQNIDFSELAELGVHFGRPHLKQWFDRKYCNATQAQESIWHFAHYLRHSKKGEIKTGPLNFFMGIMSKSKYFPRPDGYLSPEDEALKNRIESERRAAELRREMQEELFDLIFEKWFDSRTVDEINALTPTLHGLEAKKGTLRSRFRDEFYLTIRDNPTVDVLTLKLEVSSPQQLVEPPRSVQAARDPVDTFRKMVAHLTEEIRQLEDAVQHEPRDSLKTELHRSLTNLQKKRQQILDSNPILAQEVLDIEQALSGLPRSQTSESSASTGNV